jgi:hypothetical protein
VAGWIGDVTDRAEGAGRGQLKLRLDLVLGSQGEDKVAGRSLSSMPSCVCAVPLLANVNGVLEFTEADVRARDRRRRRRRSGLISVRNDAGRLRVDAAGSASVAAVRREFTCRSPTGSRDPCHGRSRSISATRRSPGRSTAR